MKKREETRKSKQINTKELKSIKFEEEKKMPQRQQPIPNTMEKGKYSLIRER